MPPSTSISDYIDRGPLRGVMLRVPVLCCLLMLTEGMDTYGVGYIGPFLTKEYGLAPAVLGMIYTATVIASLIGAVVIAPLSDRIGRRPLLIGSSLLMGACTLLTPAASSAPVLLLVRFLIGLGFGAAVPTAFALTGDYAPARHRALVTMMMSSGIALGMVLAGLLAAYIIPTFGWRAMLYVNGGLSLAWTAILFARLPESIRFLVLRHPGSDTLRALGARLAADRNEAPEPLSEPVTRKDRSPVREIFTRERIVMTLLLWFTMSMAYAVEFFMSYWLPTVAMQSGADIRTTGLVLAAGKVGSILGAIAVGATMDRRGPARVLTVTFLLTALSTVALGHGGGFAVISVALVILTCFLLDGSFAGIQALTTSAYPGAIRATGTGWVTGFSRLVGGGGGTMAGGYLVQLHWTVGAISLLMAVPMLAGSVALLWLRRAMLRAGGAAPASACPRMAAPALR